MWGYNHGIGMLLLWLLPITLLVCLFSRSAFVLRLVDNPNIEPLAATVRGKLERVMQAL